MFRETKETDLMETWQEVLKKNSIASLEVLAQRFGPENFPELDRLRQAAENFEFRISPAMVDLIKSPDDPIWRQYVPTVQELEITDGLVDSLNEDVDSPVPNITHRYPDRALFLVSPVCASYCRFCTRRRKVGDPEKIPMSQFESAFQYLEEHTEIRDVIMSGGNPLLPEYVESMGDDEILLRNFRGDRFVYKQAREEVGVGVHDPEYLFQPTFELKKQRKRSPKAAKRKTA